MFILIFLLFVVGGSLTLFALRAPVVKSQVGFNLWSRETLLLGNNLVLVVAASMILLGTLYPLVLDALTGAKLSVGPPYFNALFIPLMAPADGGDGGRRAGALEGHPGEMAGQAC